MAKRNKPKAEPKAAKPTDADARRPWRRTDLALGIALCVLTALWACHQLLNMDVWWHLKTGKLIAERLAIPHVDWFRTGFLDEGRPYIDLHWLFQVTIYGVYALAGAGGLVWLKMLVAAAAVAIATRLAREPAGRVAGYLCWLPFLFLLGGRLIVRPELPTLCFLAAYLVILDGARRRPRRVWALPVLQLVWVNTHSMFIFGPVLIAMWWADEAVRSFARREHPDKLRAKEVRAFYKRMAILTGVVVAVCFVNPYLHRGVFFPLELAGKLSGGHDEYSARIAELQTPLSVGPGNFFVQLQVALIAFCAASFLVNRKGFSVFRLLAAAAFTLLGMQATRNAGLFSLVLGTVTAANIAEFVGRTARARWAKRLPGWWPAAVRGALVAGMLLTAYLLVTDRFCAWVREDRRFGAGVTPLVYATDAIDFVGRISDAAPESARPERAFVVHMGQAAPFIFRLCPPMRVFMDGRLEVNSLETFRTYFAIREAMAKNVPGWPDVLDRLRLDVALVDHHETACETALVTNRRWQLVWHDPVASVFLHARHRALAPPVDFAQRYYRLPPPSTGGPPAWQPAGLLRRLVSRAKRPSAAQRESEALMRLDEELLKRRELGRHRGLALLAARRGRDALAEDPGSAAAHRLLGRVYYHLHISAAPVTVERAWDPFATLRIAQGVHHYREALRREPKDFRSLYYLFLILKRLKASDLAVEPLTALSRLSTSGGTERSRADSIAAAGQQLPEWREKIARETAELGLRGQWSNRQELLAKRDAALRAPLGLVGEALGLIGREFAGRMPWEVADRQGTLLLLVGWPAKARAVYESQVRVPPESRWAVEERIATTWHVEGHFARARDGYRRSLAGNPQHLAAHWGLVCLYQDIGDARAARDACQAAVAAIGLRPDREQLTAERQAIDEVARHVAQYVR